ncbi:MAG: MFS transporter [Chloroflexi bacterium]|nr:MFS transporter [Chloroflexota bacterium]
MEEERREKNLSNGDFGDAPRYRFIIIAVLSLSTFTNFLVLFNLGVLLPAISKDLGLSPSEQGWLGSSALIANLVFSLPFGWWLSRVNAKLVTTIALVAGGLFLFVQGWAPIFLVLLVGRLLFGLSGIAREPARAMLTLQWIPDREIVMMNGVLVGVIGVAIAIGFFVTPYILSRSDDNWRLAFYIFGFMTLVVAVVWHLLGRERITRSYIQRSVSQAGTPLRSLLKYRQLWWTGMGLFGANLLWFAFVTFWPTLLLDRYQVSLALSGALMAVSGIVSSVFALIVSYLMTRRDIGRAWMLVCGILITITSIGMSLTGSLPLQFAMSFINGIGWSFFPIVMTVPFKLPGIKPREVAVAIGFLEMAVWAGGAVGPVFVGMLQEATDDLQFTLIAASLFGLLLSLGAALLPSEARLKALGLGDGSTSFSPASPRPKSPPVPGGD